jgi:CheY-like chemotaxis protein
VAPLAVAAPQAALPAEAAPAAPELGGLTLLCVDDSPVNLLLLDQLLSRLGHTVVQAANGPEALEMLAARAFDLILMDIRMPGMSGMVVLDTLRRTGGPTRVTPAIALTADVTSGGLEHYLAAGVSGHTAKPIQVDELLGAMARAMTVDETAVAA